MSLRIIAIVEGHGEVLAIRPLLERIWYTHFQCNEFLEVIPWRSSSGIMLSESGLSSEIQRVENELHNAEERFLHYLILIMTDTDGKKDNCPKSLSAQMLSWANKVRAKASTQIACVLPNIEFETWFAASATSLQGYRGLPSVINKPIDPEGQSLGKGWVQNLLKRKYSPTTDQPSFAAQIDIAECYAASRSFKKLVDELQKRLPAPPAAE
jgi:hypothetical protein